MRLGPLIARELREQSRRPATYWLRVGSGLGLLGVTLLLLYRMPSAPPGMFNLKGGWLYTAGNSALEPLETLSRLFENRGGLLFGMMNFALLGWIWIVAPQLTADCLSRERREETLVLLFLTPLRPADIVHAKLIAHSLGAVAIFLSALPVLMLPVVVGGVSWLDVAKAFLLDAGALLLALSAGLWASTGSKHARAVAFAALVFSCASAFLWFCGWAVAGVVLAPDAGTLTDRLQAVIPGTLRRVGWGVRHAGDFWMSPIRFIASRGVTGVRSFASLGPPVGLVLFATCAAAVLTRLVTRRVAAAQLEGRPPPPTETAVEWLGRKRIPGNLLDRIRARLLERQPVLWAEFHAWRLRIGTWLMVVPVGLALPTILEADKDWIAFHAVTLLVAMVAAGAFQRERKAGILELLVTTPRGESVLLCGKILSLFIQSIPVALLVGVVVPLYPRAGRVPVEFTDYFPPLALHLAFIVVTGAYFSLRMRRYPGALAATSLSVWVLSPLVGFVRHAIVAMLTGNGWVILEQRTSAGALVDDTVLALAFLFLLHRALVKRRFAMH